MEDELSFNLLHECLKYLYQQDKRYNNVLFIKGLISKENFQQNDYCKLSADVLHKANGHLLFNVDLLYIDKLNNIVAPSNLSGEMLSEELFNVYNTIEKITDPIVAQLFKLNTFGPSNVIDLRSTLIKLFEDPLIFKAFTDKKNELIINTTKTSMEEIQDEYKSLLNSYRAARVRMEYSINSIFFSKIFLKDTIFL